MQESREEWALLWPQTPDKRKQSAAMGVTNCPGHGGSLGAHCVLQPLPDPTTGNAEDLKACETSSGVSQLNGLTRAVAGRTPLCYS